MTDRNHPIDVLGVYAADALDADERDEIEAHLATCRSCREEVDAHRATLAGLSPDADAEGPPPAVWDAISARLGDVDTADERARRRARRVRSGWLAAAAAVVALITGAVVVVAAGEDETADLGELAQQALDDQTTTLVSLADGDAQVARVAVADDGVAYLLLDDLGELPSGRSYQVWRLGGDEAVSLAVAGDGRARVIAFVVPPGTEEIAITVEPARGVAQPTGPVVAAGRVEA